VTFDRFMNRKVNPLTAAILRSRVHGLISRRVVLLEYRGRRSGRRLSVPASYRREDDELRIVSSPRRVWWRNLQGGAPVRVLLRGTWRDATATAESGATVAIRVVLQPAAPPAAPRAEASAPPAA
jgi:hypothetical protein